MTDVELLKERYEKIWPDGYAIDLDEAVNTAMNN